MSMFQESLRAFLKPVTQYLDDESVSEIMINGEKDVWIERKGRLYKTDATFTEEGLLGAARNMAQYVGRPLSEDRPRLDARLPDGSRIHVVLPPIARKGTTISIRKFFRDKLTPENLIKFGSITPPMVRVIEAAVRVKLNMLVSGGTGSGKTTLLNILSSLIPNDERILTIEDSAELQLNQEHLVPFESRPPDKYGKGEVNMGHLLHSALRLRPDRIIVGEVRGGEAFDLMQAMNTGHGGSMATTHANTPTESLRRIESLCLMSSVELPMVAVRAQVAAAINFVVCCERLQDGSRKTIAISEVLPLNEKGDYRTQDIWLYIPVTKDEQGNILGYHAPTGILPTFLAKARAYGFTDLDEKYFDPATYNLPPPPLIHGVGENVTTHWAPSLKHREKHLPDPDEFEQRYREFEHQLQEDARKKNAEKAGGSKGSAQVQVPPSPGPKPASAAPARPSQSAAPRPARDDATPPPTRNPLLAKKPPEPGDDEAPSDEGSVQVDDELMAEGEGGEGDSDGTNIKAYPQPPANRPRPAGAPQRPTTGPGARPPTSPHRIPPKR
ncbi:MAG: Flp pilus assembly complex ATPase component TadA [Myxococcaceae bacterium]|nr:Flp pilus assembly complex ATPase component TadA [Myxococcaceae bacterium]